MTLHRKCVLFAGVLLSACTTRAADLYLLTGSPTNNLSEEDYALRLLRVRGGAAEIVADVIEQKRGVEWVGLSPEHATALALTRKPWEFVALDLASAATVKRCRIPLGDESGYAALSPWGAELPGGNYALKVAWNNSTITMNSDPTLSCSESISTARGIDLSMRVSNGAFGADEWHSEGEYWVVPNVDGSLMRVAWNGEASLMLPYVIPREWVGVARQGISEVVVNNSQCLVMSLGPATSRTLLALRKKDQTWLKLPLPGEMLPRVRAFGDFIVGIEWYPRNAKHPTAAGEAAWRNKATATGPNWSERRHASLMVRPGRFHIYSLSTGKIRSIETGQADSEVLLIQDSTVFYRVLNRLYRAEMTETGIKPGELVATSDLLEDAHWAFWGGAQRE